MVAGGDVANLVGDHTAIFCCVNLCTLRVINLSLKCLNGVILSP